MQSEARAAGPGANGASGASAYEDQWRRKEQERRRIREEQERQEEMQRRQQAVAEAKEEEEYAEYEMHRQREREVEERRRAVQQAEREAEARADAQAEVDGACAVVDDVALGRQASLHHRIEEQRADEEGEAGEEERLVERLVVLVPEQTRRTAGEGERRAETKGGEDVRIVAKRTAARRR